MDTESEHHADCLQQSDIIVAISRGLHTRNDAIDQNIVKRKQEFFEKLLPDKSSVKAFIQKCG